jgi:hypothetical protein
MEPIIFERPKKGRKLISYLERKLSRAKWRNRGWDWNYENTNGFAALMFWYNCNPASSRLRRCEVVSTRPNVITVPSADLYTLILDLISGYKDPVLIEVVK